MPTSLPSLLGAAALAALLAATPAAHAEPPMVTDDASTLDAGSAKVELGWSREAGTRAIGLALGYAPTDGIEGEVSFERTHARSTDPATVLRATGLAIKWVPLVFGETRLGLKLEHGHERADGVGASRDTRLLGLLSHRLPTGQGLHLNIGRDWQRDDSGTRARAWLWSLGADQALSESVQLTADFFGSSGSRPGHQLGVRWTLADGYKLSAAVGRIAHQPTARLVAAWEF